MSDVFPQTFAELALASAPEDDPQVFTDVSTYLTGFASQRGANDERSLVETGTLTARLKNSDGRFTPENASGPYFGNLKLMRRFRILAGWPTLLSNHNFETNTTGWQATGAGASIAHSTAQARFGSGSALVTVDSSGDGIEAASANETAAAPGEVWTGYVWARLATGTPPNATCVVQALTSGGGLLATYTGTAQALSTSEWRRFTVTTPALPATTAKLRLRLVTSSGTTATFYADGALLSKYAYAPPWSRWPNAKTPIFEGFVEAYRDVPAKGGFETICELDAVDLMKPLAYYQLPTPQPFGETLYDSVVAAKPFIYLPLNEVSGTDAENHGVTSGTNGRYKNLPTFEAPTMVRGETDTAVTFDRASSQYVSLPGLGKFAAGRDPPYGGGTPAGKGEPTFHMLYKTTALPSTGQAYVLLSGEYHSGRDEDLWQMRIADDHKLRFNIRLSTGGGTLLEAIGGTTLQTGVEYSFMAFIYHKLVSTLWRVSIAVFVNGYLDGLQELIPGASDIVMPTQTATSTEIRIGSSAVSGGTGFTNGTIQHVAIEDNRHPFLDGFDLHLLRQLGFDQQAAGARVTSILDLIPDAWTTRYIETGVRNIQSRRQFGQTALEELRLVEAADAGRLFVAADGTVSFLDGDYRTSAPWNVTQVALSNVPSPPTSYPYSSLDQSPLDDAYLYNVVRAKRAGTEIQQEASDATSVGQYFERMLDLGDLIVSTDAEALDICEENRDRYKQPLKRITSVVLDGDYDKGDGELWRHMLDRDLEDQVAVTYDPPGAPAFSQTCRIKSVAHDVHGTKWTTTWGLAPAAA